MKTLYTSLLALILTGNIAFSQGGLDLGVTGITIPAPGTSLLTTYSDTFAFKIFNFGDTLYAGDTLHLNMYLDGVMQPAGSFSTLLVATWESQVELTVSASFNFGLLNISAGTHSICMGFVNYNDVDNSNDSACATYTFTVPTGIGLTLGSKSSIYLNNGILNLNITHSDIVESTTLTVYNMAGRLVYAEDIGGNGSISSTVDLSSYATGVYVVRLVSKGRLIDTRKLIK